MKNYKIILDFSTYNNALYNASFDKVKPGDALDIIKRITKIQPLTTYVGGGFEIFIIDFCPDNYIKWYITVVQLTKFEKEIKSLDNPLYYNIKDINDIHKCFTPLKLAVLLNE